MNWNCSEVSVTLVLDHDGCDAPLVRLQLMDLDAYFNGRLGPGSVLNGSGEGVSPPSSSATTEGAGGNAAAGDRSIVGGAKVVFAPSYFDPAAGRWDALCRPWGMRLHLARRLLLLDKQISRGADEILGLTSSSSSNADSHSGGGGSGDGGPDGVSEAIVTQDEYEEETECKIEADQPVLVTLTDTMLHNVATGLAVWVRAATAPLADATAAMATHRDLPSSSSDADVAASTSSFKSSVSSSSSSPKEKKSEEIGEVGAGTGEYGSDEDIPEDTVEGLPRFVRPAGARDATRGEASQRYDRGPMRGQHDEYM